MLAEPNLSLRWMNIHVHFRVRHLKKQQNHRENRGRKNVAIRLRERVVNEAVADEPAVDKCVNRIAIQLLNLRLGDETVQP